MRGKVCAIWYIILLLLVGAAALAEPQPARPEVAITPQAGGGMLVTTPVYTARLGADGNLHSLLVNGIEFLDDAVAGSAGASFFVEHAIPLPTLTAEDDTVTATDGTYTIAYRFDEGYITLKLRQDSAKGAAFVLTCSSRIAYVEHLGGTGYAATPADYGWEDVMVTVPTGEFLKLHNGSRIWGRELGRQVWERSDIAPGKDYSLMLIPGRGDPRTPSLAQLTSLSAALDAPEALVPAGSAAALQVRFDNNSNQSLTAEMAVRVESSSGELVMEGRKPFACEPHQTVSLPWTITPKKPDFYTAVCTVNLGEASKKFALTFGYDVTAIAPVPQQPIDFVEYWSRAYAEAKVSEVKLTRLEDPTQSTDTVTVYRVGLEAAGFTCYGWLTVPKKPGRYPGLLVLPAERVKRISPNPTLLALANNDFVAMTIEPTGQPVDGNVKPLITRAFTNPTDPAAFGLRAVMIRYLRALTALSGQVPEADPNRLGVTGIGLGGGMAMMLGAIDERVQAVAPDLPLYCHIELGKEDPDWPYQEILAMAGKESEERDEALQTLRYYDVANFAGALNCPVLISAGINDDYSRLTSIYGVYNRLPGPHAVKLYDAHTDGWAVRLWTEQLRWLRQVLGGASPPAAPVAPAAPAAGDAAP